MLAFTEKRDFVSKKLSLFLCIILLAGVSHAQQGFPKLLYSDFVQLPSDSLNTIYYTYKIPLNHLVFEKEANLFLAQYRISVEVFDSKDEKFITRSIKEKNIQVPDYEQTRSPIIFSEGILTLNLNPGIYSVIEILYDYKSNREMRQPPMDVKFDTLKNIISPLVIEDQTIECNGKDSPVLANYGGQLPFDEDKYSFIIPVIDKGKDSLFVQIIQNKDTLYRNILTDPIKETVSLSECGGKVFLDESREKTGYNLFRIDGVSNHIAEGPFQIKASLINQPSGQDKFTLACQWINKPVSLRDPEMAIEALKFIEKDSVINSLLKGEDKDYEKKLAAYWKKIDPTPETEFNPLMQEFYTRIDYAIRNFKTIAGANGANTDRGKVYIKFGKPENIDRTSDNHGNIIETWTYINPQRKFVFVDKKGTGDFSLISG